jgi:hypothetical protein
VAWPGCNNGGYGQTRSHADNYNGGNDGARAVRLQSIRAFRGNFLVQYRSIAEQMNELKGAINVYILTKNRKHEGGFV